MNRNQFLRLCALAHEVGPDEAWDVFQQESYEGDCDTQAALRDDPQDEPYIFGCGPYDSVDSRGRPLKPAVNDAGEPWWM